MGVHSDVFEQAEELREVGAGLTVWANAIRALELLGVAQRVLPLSSKLDCFECRTRTGRVLSAISFLNLEKKLGIPVGVVVHRADLLRELAAGLDQGRIHCGARCVSIENKSDGVIARFAT